MDHRGTTETERIRRIWERTAPKYDRRIAFWERVLFKDSRTWVCSRATGKTLEIAIGTGRNLGLYPPDIELTGIDLSSSMLEIARRRADDLGRAADLRVGDAQALEFPGESFDTVVVTLALCSVPDDRRAVAEVSRVLRPGGQFVLLEHVRSPVRAVRAVQRVLDPIAVRVEGDHYLRDPLEHLRAEGFAIEEVQRSGWGIVLRAVARKS